MYKKIVNDSQGKHCILSEYYDEVFVSLDCDTRLFVKKVKKHWWSSWKYVTFAHNEKKYMQTYVWDNVTNYFKPANGIYWKKK